MIQIAIVDDEPQCIAQLRRYLEKFQRENSTALEVSAFSNGAALLDSYRGQYDLLLLDIEMPLMDGMTVAERIRRQDPEVIILFITNMSQYAIRGYEVGAMDYLLKPLSYFPFSQRLGRALSRVQKKAKHYLVVPVKGGAQKLDTEDIYYVESQGHNLLFHTAGGVFVTPGALKDVEEKLASLNFSRCNKGYLVSLSHVDGIIDGCAVVQGEKLLISRGRKAEFMEALANCVGGDIL